MESFLLSILICALLVNILATAFFIYKTISIESLIIKHDKEMEVEVNLWVECFGSVEDKLDNISYESQNTLQRIDKISEKLDELTSESFLNLSSTNDKTEQTKPHRPNNWDSMKAAFKGPARGEDVRDRAI